MKTKFTAFFKLLIARLLAAGCHLSAIASFLCTKITFKIIIPQPILKLVRSIPFSRPKIVSVFFFILAIFGQALVFYFIITETTLFTNFSTWLSRMGFFESARNCYHDAYHFNDLHRAYYYVPIKKTSFFTEIAMFALFFFIYYAVLFLATYLYLLMTVRLIISKDQIAFLDVMPFLNEALSHVLWLDHWVFTIPGIEAFIQIEPDSWRVYVETLRNLL